MNPMIEFKTATPLFLIVLLLACFALSQRAQGVVPPPPGGYPNFTTAAGDHALQALTSGVGNTAIGTFSLFSTTTASFNTAVGAGALDLNTGDSNTAVGVAALLLNTGAQNTAVGVDALGLNTAGEFNAGVGAFALYNNVSGAENNAFGNEALTNNVNGNDNNAFGSSALHDNVSGVGNVAIGQSALRSNVNGSRNTVVGYAAGLSLQGDDNIYIGANVDPGAAESTRIRIGTPGPTFQFCYIAGIFNANAVGAANVTIDADGKLHISASSARFKEDIKPMDKASESIFALKPVTFRYKKEYDAKGTQQFGLVAEEVAKVNPDLVVPDVDGKPYTVRFEQVNAMLLNEFLKEHRKNEEQEATIARQQKQIDALTAGLQKVSAELEVGKPAPQTVQNTQ